MRAASVEPPHFQRGACTKAIPGIEDYIRDVAPLQKELLEAAR
jgi:hypothetical protein